jgi:hypothetical protein
LFRDKVVPIIHQQYLGWWLLQQEQ